MSYLSGIDRNQNTLVTASLDDVIDENNPVRVVDAFINAINLKQLGFKEYEGNNRGQHPYKRSELLKLHMYGYLNGIRSSRKLEIESKRNLEVMWLINSISPDHGTISLFMKENKDAFRKILKEFTLILKGWGMIDGKLIALDGTKLRAQNSNHNCITESKLNKKLEYVEEQIDSYINQLENNYKCKDASISLNAKEIREKINTYTEMKEEYEKQKNELSEKGLEQISLIDEDSRRMKNNGKLEVCYNVQSVVDSKNCFVVDCDVVNDINDLNQLSQMALKAKKLLNKRKMIVVADTGYYNAEEIKKCVDKKLILLIKKSRLNNQTGKNEFRKDKFKYIEGQDIYLCPENQILSFSEYTTKNKVKYKRYKCKSCDQCLKRNHCTTSKDGRNIQRWINEEILESVAYNTYKNNEIYKKRRSIVEHPFGTIKRTMGYTYFLRKGLDSVNAEAASIFVAYNLKRLLGKLTVPKIIEKFSQLS